MTARAAWAAVRASLSGLAAGVGTPAPAATSITANSRVHTIATLAATGADTTRAAKGLIGGEDRRRHRHTPSREEAAAISRAPHTSGPAGTATPAGAALAARRTARARTRRAAGLGRTPGAGHVPSSPRPAGTAVAPRPGTPTALAAVAARAPEPGVATGGRRTAHRRR